jgi:hypothetical protein
MSRLTAIVVLAAAVLASEPARAQKDPTGDVAAGIRQMEEGDLEAAARTLQRAVDQLAADRERRKDLAVAQAYLAMAHLGLGHGEQARGAMREAFRADRDLALDPKKFPPRVRLLLDEVRKAAGVETRPAAAPEAPAYSLVGLAPGRRVRVSGPSTSDRLVVGTVISVSGDSATVRSDSTKETFNVSASSATRFEVSGGKGSRGGRRILFGLLGAVLFGGAGAAYGNGPKLDPACVEDAELFDFPKEFCDFGDKKGVGKWAGIGAGSGLVLGVLLGGLGGGQEVWRPVERVRVGLSLERGRSVWVSVAF